MATDHDVMQDAMAASDTVAPVPNKDVELAALPAKPDNDPYLVVFEEPFDADNPKDWSRSKKWTVTDVMAATGFNRIVLSTIMAPALTTIAHDLSMSRTEAVTAMSSYMLAAVFGPSLLGPLSEVYGRGPVLHASNLWFLVWNIVCGFAGNKTTLLSARFLAGFGASAVYSLAGGVLGDIWRPEQRGKSLAIYMLIPLLGGAVGPIIAVMVVISFPAFHETYAPLILRQRAKNLRRETGDPRYQTAAERLQQSSSVRRFIIRNLTRPLRLLATHPAVQCLTLVSGFGYGVLYIVLSTFSDMWTTKYHESIETSGLHYLSVAVGEIAGSQIGAAVMDSMYRKLTLRADGSTAPEYHLPIMIPGTIVASIGLLVYGWAATFSVHWAIVDLGVLTAFTGFPAAYMGIQAYAIDAYPEHASSAIAASQFVRSLTAYTFPLFAPAMYSALGYGWGNSAIAVANLVISIGVPVLIWTYGARFRARVGSSD